MVKISRFTPPPFHAGLPLYLDLTKISGLSKSIQKHLKVRENSQGWSNFRYNVNGIEIHPLAFHKLSREISLRSIECLIPEIQSKKIKFFTGTFPTSTGRYQRLIIREGTIPHVHKHDLKLITMTHKKYYEVCTNAIVYDYFKKNGL